jgi:hypothetical protein
MDSVQGSGQLGMQKLPDWIFKMVPSFQLEGRSKE